jgi:hypothetical protein
MRSVKEECLSKVILSGSAPYGARSANTSSIIISKRNHHGKDNVLLFARAAKLHSQGPVQCR